jgi:hypothetical protein
VWEEVLSIQSHHPFAIVAVWSSGMCLIHGKNILDVIIDLPRSCAQKGLNRTPSLLGHSQHHAFLPWTRSLTHECTIRHQLPQTHILIFAASLNIHNAFGLSNFPFYSPIVELYCANNVNGYWQTRLTLRLPFRTNLALSIPSYWNIALEQPA